MTQYCGRHFSDTQIELIRQMMVDHPEYHRADLSRHICRMLPWYKADGGLKEMSCRVAMLRMHGDGLIQLPPPRRTKADQEVIALLGFGAAAWQAAPRDNYIGWSHTLRKRHLPLIVNNARFLILPWVQVKNLASKILSMAVKQLPEDWQKLYEIKPVLMETFVETDRFAGTCYKAANWVHVGTTKGRGKLGPSNVQSVPLKDILLYPLDRGFRKILTT